MVCSEQRYAARIEPGAYQYLFELRFIGYARDYGDYNVRHKILPLRYDVRSGNCRTDWHLWYR